jgi:hypothetical protein
LDITELLVSISPRHVRVGIEFRPSAAGLHLVLRSSMVAHPIQQQIGSFAQWVCFAYYPIALYKVLKLENSISRTNRAREAFERMLESVHKERRLRLTDIDYVTGTEWDTVPWNEFTGSIYYSQ